MNEVSFIQHIASLNQKDKDGLNSFINSLNQTALSALREVADPNVSDEEWRFTSLKPLYKERFTTISGDPQSTLLSQSLMDTGSSARLVFVNGLFHESWSDVSSIVDFAKVIRFSKADDDEMRLIQTHLNKHIPLGQDAFLLLNTACLHDGIWINIPKNTEVPHPIHLVFVNTSESTSAHFPRVLITAERSSKATIVEESIGEVDATYLNVPVLEFDLQQNAHVTHIKLQNDSKKAYHIGRVGASIARDGHYESYSVQLGAKISRNDIIATQIEDQMFATLDGLVMIKGDQVSDTHTLMDHAKPYGESHQLHKVIVEGAATSVFNGKIFVRQDAQKVNSFQENRNLLLSNDATVHTKPQLEIFADDVKCSHGATVGQLVPEELFYLKSRGLDDDAARNMLTNAFALEVIEHFPIPFLRDRLSEVIAEFTRSESPESVSLTT